MPSRRKTQDTPFTRQTAEVYRSFKDIFSDFIGLVERPVSAGTDSGIRYKRNKFKNSTLLRCNIEKPLPAGNPYNEER